MTYRRPACEVPGCHAPADMYTPDASARCARHVLDECECGRVAPALDLAAHGRCGACRRIYIAAAKALGDESLGRI